MGRVLIIDDEHTYRTQLSLILKSRGHDVRSAGDGREGISIGTTFLPEVLVVDWRLKDTLSALDIADALLTVVPGLQTIIITGYASQDLPPDVRDRVFRILEKPFGLDEFVDTVKEALVGRGPST